MTMKLIKIISESKSGNRMEVIAEEDNIRRTLHIHKENNVWKYFAGCYKDKKVFFPITI